MNHYNIAKFIQNSLSREKWSEDRDAAEKTLAQRRARYASDEDYKKSIKDSVKRNRELKQPSERKRSFNRDRVVVVNGVSVFLYSSGKAAHHIGISAKTLDQWERQDVIPVNHAVDLVGRRWYPVHFVTFMVEQVALRIKKERLATWSTRVKEAWRARQLSNNPIPVVCERLDNE